MHKTFDVIDVKQGRKDEGTFEAIVSVFGNVDLGGDRMVKGAFERTLKEWQDSGDPIPVIFSHDWGNQRSYIGKVLEAEEMERGLFVKGQLWLDDPDAAKVWRLMDERVVKEFSFGYDVKRERMAKDGANEILDVDLIEVGPTLKGMNPATELLAVKAGRAISKATASKIRTAISALEEVLALGEPEPEKAVEAQTGNGAASDELLERLRVERQLLRKFREEVK